jgi:hypothetical protein
MIDNYVAADFFLLPWARENGLVVSTLYRDEIVRSIAVNSVLNREPKGQKAQLWITPPDHLGNLEVHVAVGTWHHSVETTLNRLCDALSSELLLLKEH